MKLEVGMYVRTKKGHIDKIIKIDNRHHRTIKVECGEEEYCMGCWEFTDWFAPEHYIKASHNIIDLIEVGDYVNGSKVVEISEYNGEKYVYVEETEYSNANQTDINVYYKNEYIETIVTKERFEAMAYKVV